MATTTTPHHLSNKHILITGAGLSGLSFTRALQTLFPPNHPPPRLTILERDTQHDAEGRQGYTLSLAGTDTSTSGLSALRDLGLLDSILARSIIGLDSGSFKIWTADFKEWMSIRPRGADGIPTGAVRVARRDLRRILLDAVGEDKIRWGSMCSSAEKLPNGKIRVTVQTGGTESVEECDLLVVADGANSKIRAGLRPEDGLDFAGAVQLVGVATFPEGGVPGPVDRNWGLQVSNARGVCCFYAPTDAQNVLWSLSFLEGRPRPKRTYATREDMQPLLDEARERGKVLGEQFLRIVEATTDPAGVSCLSARDKKPFVHDDPGAGIVYIGDSNHAVSPFAGYGANLALKDGWDLAKSLVETGSVAEAVRRYDGLSYSRAVKVLDSSRWRIRNAHSTGVRFWLFRALIVFGGYMFWVMGRS